MTAIPKSLTPTPIRFDADQKAHIKKWAEERGISSHAAVKSTALKAMGYKAPHKPAPRLTAKQLLAETEKKTAHLGKPKPRKAKKPASKSLKVVKEAYKRLPTPSIEDIVRVTTAAFPGSTVAIESHGDTPVHVSVPGKPTQIVAPRSKWDLSSVQFGSTPQKPGSNLKGTKGK